MQKLIAVAPLALLAACQTGPKLEDDTRYVKLAKVVEVHEFTDTERKEAAKTAPRSSNSGLGLGIGFGMGTGGFSGGFGGIMLATGTGLGSGRSSGEAPQVADGANRYTVQPMNSSERIEVMSYKSYKAGDCVKLMSGHPSEYARLFDPKQGERCE